MNIYADDTSMFTAGKLSEEIVDEANLTLQTLDEWTGQNSLGIKTNKAKAVLFCSKNKNVVLNHPTLLDSTPVALVSSFKIDKSCFPGNFVVGCTYWFSCRKTLSNLSIVIDIYCHGILRFQFITVCFYPGLTTLIYSGYLLHKKLST